jgi:hypothetical protein
VALGFFVADFFAPLAALVEDFFAAFFELLEPLVVFEADLAPETRRAFLVGMFPLLIRPLKGGVVTKQRLPIAEEASLVVDH